MLTVMDDSVFDLRLGRLLESIKGLNSKFRFFQRKREGRPPKGDVRFLMWPSHTVQNEDLIQIKSCMILSAQEAAT